MRSQDLVLASDALPAGTITKMEWHPSDHILAGDYSKFRLKLCHTSVTALGTAFASNYAGRTPVQVYYRDPVHVAPAAEQWFGFPFDTDFEYNGADNLLVEVWWEEDTEGYVNTYIRKLDRRGLFSCVRYGRPESGYPDAGELMNYLHHMRLTIEGVSVSPASLGRVKALYR
jgi:hypothetical protein